MVLQYQMYVILALENLQSRCLRYSLTKSVTRRLGRFGNDLIHDAAQKPDENGSVNERFSAQYNDFESLLYRNVQKHKANSLYVKLYQTVRRAPRKFRDLESSWFCSERIFISFKLNETIRSYVFEPCSLSRIIPQVL